MTEPNAASAAAIPSISAVAATSTTRAGAGSRRVDVQGRPRRHGPGDFRRAEGRLLPGRLDPHSSVARVSDQTRAGGSTMSDDSS